MKRLVAGSLLAMTLGCAPSPGGAAASVAPYDWHLPADNPMTVAKVELGRRLFYDKRLSRNRTQSCASCHDQALAFTDGKAKSVGSTGETHPRSSMSIVNVGYASTLTWANPVLTRLENQALVPIFGELPTELGFIGQETELQQRLSDDADYRQHFAAAFPQETPAVSMATMTKALAAFQRSIVSFDAPFDRYERGDATAVSEAAIRGRDLYFSERLECFHCHGGFNYSQSTVHSRSAFTETTFFNTGLYNLDGTGAYPAGGRGLYEISTRTADMGAFKPPSLRNVALTAPYMHDGSIATLSEVIDHYASGGRTITGGPHAGVGATNPYKSSFVKGFTLTAAEKADLLAFLDSLTDRNVTTNPAWSDPFVKP
jgi:cytochrome c peroxidase